MGGIYNFIEWLRRCRGALGLTQRAFAQQLGYAFATYRKLESGERSPSHPFVERLADFLDFSDQERAMLHTFAQTGACDRSHALLQRALTRTPQFEHPHAQTVLLPTHPIDRDTELATLLTLLRQPIRRLIALVGPSRAEQTMLALHTAAALAVDQDDRICFASFTVIDDPLLVLTAIVESLEVRKVGGQPLLASLQAALGKERQVLPSDNPE